MTRSESITHLAAALAMAQAEMPVAVFDATNPFLKSKYASLGSVIQASRPILAKHKLSLVQFPISQGTPHPACGHLLPSAEKEGGAHGGPSRTGGNRTDGTDGTNGAGARAPEFIGVESILMHESGEFVAERVVIPLTEEKGKTRVQCAGSTLTYLRRYSWAAILGMYSDEDSDGGSPLQAFAPKAAPMLPPPPMNKIQNN
jgi:hypothetical protein